MFSMTLAQIAEKPITVATEEAISNFADSRQGLSPSVFRQPDRMHPLPISLHAPEMLKLA
jgi:hypothetical protein